MDRDLWVKKEVRYSPVNDVLGVSYGVDEFIHDVSKTNIEHVGKGQYHQNKCVEGSHLRLRSSLMCRSEVGDHSRPSLPIIPISPLFCARLRGDGTGSAAPSTPSPVPSPVISSGVIRSVRRYLIVCVVIVVIVALKISTLCTSYHQLPPQINKN